MNVHLVACYNLSFDGDEWGNCQAWRFAIAHLLHHMDRCPDEWQYVHGLCYADGLSYLEDVGDDTEQDIMDMLRAGLVNVLDLIEFGTMLNNLRDILELENKDY